MFKHELLDGYQTFNVYGIYNDLDEEIALVDEDGIIYGTPSIAMKTRLSMSPLDWSELMRYVAVNIDNKTNYKIQTYSEYGSR